MLVKFFRRGKGEPDVASQAASAIREYAREHAALFEREERLRAKAERLAEAGTPSESANNRAERAGMEIEAGLLALRENFAPSAGERRRAFDHELGRLYPRFAIPAGNGATGERGGWWLFRSYSPEVREP